MSASGSPPSPRALGNGHSVLAPLHCSSPLRPTATRPSAVHRHVHRPVTGEHAGELDVIGDGRLGLDFSAALTAP